jgi:membrane protein required for colicin V production
MTFLDLLILVFLGFFLYRGAKKGLIRELFALIAVLGALLCAVVFVDVGVAMIKDLAEIPASVALFISFFLIFIVIFLVIRIIGAILSQIVRLAMLRWLDRLGGLAFGFLKGLLIASLILLGVTLLSWPKDANTYIKRSVFGPSVRRAAPYFFNRMKFVLPTAKSIYKEFQESIDVYTDFNSTEMKEKAVQEVLHIFRKAE